MLLCEKFYLLHYEWSLIFALMMDGRHSHVPVILDFKQRDIAARAKDDIQLRQQWVRRRGLAYDN